MGVKQSPLSDPLPGLLHALWYREYVLQVLHRSGVLRVDHMFLADEQHTVIQGRKRSEAFF